MCPSERELPSLPGTAGGREELRAAMLKPYLLRLKSTRGEKAALALLSTVGLSPQILENEAEWISVAAAARALRALSTALGDDAIASRGDWTTHPETLGGYVNLLRVAAEPIDAYRYLVAHAAESTRVGSYAINPHGKTKARIFYRPRPDADSDQDFVVLCAARRAEFRSIPRLWGLPDARLTDHECISRGDDCCRYELEWDPLSGPSRVIPAAAVAVAVCAGLVLLSGSPTAAIIGGVAGGLLGAMIGTLMDRNQRELANRTLEKNRIAALERGLELRGQARVAPGELVGSVLGGKYRILKRIGAGGIGAVYAAQHIALGATVAIKVLRGAAARDASEIARLRREAQVQVSIQHPNVVRTIDLDQMGDGSIYVVMELLKGSSLADQLRRESHIRPAVAVPMFMQVCRALHEAHRLGVVHRDMKPGNIFICDDRTVKVLDFGMSKLAEAEALTEDGYTLGTPEYMSPEQCVGAPVDQRSDIYALGIVMYEALTGELPLQSSDRRETLRMHQRTQPLPMRERRPDLSIPVELDDLVSRCLSKRAALRPATARELEKHLMQVPL